MYRTHANVTSASLEPTRGDPPAPRVTPIGTAAGIRAALGSIVACGGAATARGQAVRIRLVGPPGAPPERVELTHATPLVGVALPGELEARGVSAIYRFRLDGVFDPARDTFVAPLPSLVLRVQRRAHLRASAPPGMRVRLGHPWRRDVERAWHDVVDLGPGGLGIAVAAGSSLAPGADVACIELHASGRVVHLRGVVRHRRSGPDGGTVCGLAITPWPGDEGAWQDVASAALVPTTAVVAAREPALWELLGASGFLALGGRTPASFEPLRPAVAAFAVRAAAAPGLACQVVWPSPRGLEATCSTLKAHRHTWTSFQVARRPGAPPDIAPAGLVRDVYLRLYAHQQLDPDFRWAVSFVERTTPAVDRSHVQFARAHAASGRAVCMPVRLMHAHTAERAALPPSLALTLGPASADERARLLAVLGRTRPRAYLEALDLVPERLDLADVATAWAAVGWRRERALIAARVDGRAVAVLVVERGEPGASLFQLFEQARIVALGEPGERADVAVYAALVDAARAWFEHRGYDHFTYVREDDDDRYAAVAHLHDCAAAQPFLWIIAAELVPDLLDHVTELASHAPTRTEAPHDRLPG